MIYIENIRTILIQSLCGCNITLDHFGKELNIEIKEIIKTKFTISSF